MKKKEADKIYKELRKEYTDEEIAESHVFSTDVTDEEQKELKEYIKKESMQRTDIEKKRVRDFIEKLRKKDC